MQYKKIIDATIFRNSLSLPYNMINNIPNIWEQFAKDSNGIFIPQFSFHSAKTEIEYNSFKIVFDNYTLWSGKYSKKMTRIIVPLDSLKSFRFKISGSNLQGNIEKLFGAQDVKIGLADFDNRFIIKTNDEHKIKTLLQNKKIRNLIEEQDNVHLEISDQNGIWGEKLARNHFELSFYDDGKIKDIARLKSLLELFKEMINDLIEMKLIEPKLL